MSVTGPGCTSCDGKGDVQVPGGGVLERKPCDDCGGGARYVFDFNTALDHMTAILGKPTAEVCMGGAIALWEFESGCLCLDTIGAKDIAISARRGPKCKGDEPIITVESMTSLDAATIRALAWMLGPVRGELGGAG